MRNKIENALDIKLLIINFFYFFLNRCISQISGGDAYVTSNSLFFYKLPLISYAFARLKACRCHIDLCSAGIIHFWSYHSSRRKLKLGVTVVRT